MSQIIVKYHNDFNKVRLPNLNEQEQNLLFTILAKIKEIETNGQIITLYPQDLQVNDKLANSKQYLTDIIDSLKAKFFKADFKQITETETTYTESTFNLFQTMHIHYTKQESDNSTDTSRSFLSIDLVVNPTFSYLIKELTANFTRFELEEFLRLNSKYSKTLYRLLKQFRNSGKCIIYANRWQDFCEIMNIPKDYKQSKIDEKILKPCIKELSAERNLFNSQTPIFKNLTYKKIKDPKGRGRGGKVIGIELYFTPDKNRDKINKNIRNTNATAEKLQENAELKTSKAESKLLEKKIDIFGKLVDDTQRFLYTNFQIKNNLLGGYDSCKIVEIYQGSDLKIHIKAKNMESDPPKVFSMSFESLEHMKNAINPG